MNRQRILWALFVAYVAATAVHIGWIMAHEPFSFDAWNIAIDTGAKPATPQRFVDYWWFEYTHGNPRFGQAITYLSYKIDLVAEIITPLAYLAISLAVTVLGLGRWPRRGRDLALWCVAIGVGWFALPQIGRNMFCRAYSANYVCGAAIQLWFLVPLRLARPEQSIGRCVAYALLGVIAGMCNEHTGPALIALLAGYAWWQRDADVKPRLAWAGAAGMLVGFLALFFAPGQGERYEGLATRVSLPMRLIQRGIIGNFDIIRDYLGYAAPLLALLVVIFVIAMLRGASTQRTAMRGIVLALGVGLVVCATLFVSPKLGSRFFIVPCALLLAALIALAEGALDTSRRMAPFVVLAVVASGYAAARTIPLFAKVSAQGEARLAALEATTPGDVFVGEAFDQLDESWWFIGDEMRKPEKRVMLADYFGLAKVFLRSFDETAPIGLAGARFVPRYWTSGSTSAELDPSFGVGDTKGFDLAGLQRATHDSVEILRRRLAPAPLERFELGVAFIGAAPPLPRDKLLVARWAGGTLEGYTAQIVRKGRTTQRELVLGKALAATKLDLYIVRIGDAPRKLDATRTYAPWRGGVYWALACDTDVCWVIAATRQGGG